MLKTNMRASGDTNFASWLNQLRCTDWNVDPISVRALRHLKVLTAADVSADPDWKFAPVAVMGNPEANVINACQVMSFAKHFNLPLVRWKMEMECVDRANLGEDDAIYKAEPILWQYFCPGAPGMY
jgi:hypothetical protein